MNRYEEILSRFGSVTVGVVGDIVADLYIMGSPQRLSREAPVMIVRYEEERLIPGCAANTMNNLLSLGCRVLPVALLGGDETGARLKRAFISRMPLDGICECPELQTVTKTRILVGDLRRTKQQVIRIDKELEQAPPPGAQERVLEAVERLHPRVDAWLVSDYDYFVITPAVAELLRSLCRDGTILVVDSRYRCDLFPGATCMTPNEGEALELAGLAERPRERPDVERVGCDLLRRLQVKSLLITRGNQGMSVFEPDRPAVAIPALGEEEVVDVSGAGDTVAATVTAALACGAGVLDAASLASCAASVVVMKTGAASCTPGELRSRIPLLERGPGG